MRVIKGYTGSLDYGSYNFHVTLHVFSTVIQAVLLHDVFRCVGCCSIYFIRYLLGPCSIWSLYEYGIPDSSS